MEEEAEEVGRAGRRAERGPVYAGPRRGEDFHPGQLYLAARAYGERTDAPALHDLGPMNYVCLACQARQWACEQTVRNSPSFAKPLLRARPRRSASSEIAPAPSRRAAPQDGRAIPPLFLQHSQVQQRLGVRIGAGQSRNAAWRGFCLYGSRTNDALLIRCTAYCRRGT